MITVFKYVKDSYAKEKLLSTYTLDRNRNNKLRQQQTMFFLMSDRRIKHLRDCC